MHSFHAYFANTVSGSGGGGGATTSPIFGVAQFGLPGSLPETPAIYGVNLNSVAEGIPMPVAVTLQRGLVVNVPTNTCDGDTIFRLYQNAGNIGSVTVGAGLTGIFVAASVIALAADDIVCMSHDLSASTAGSLDYMGSVL